MSPKIIAIVALITGVSLGCAPESKKVAAAEAHLDAVRVQEAAQAKASAERIEVAGNRLDQAKEAARENRAEQARNEAEAVQAYVYARKADYIARMKGELVRLETELTRLGEIGSTRINAEHRLAQVRASWARANERLDAAGNATEETWEDMKVGVSQASKDLDQSFLDLRQWLADAIEPTPSP